MSLATFDYQVRDRAGKVVRGRIEAESPAVVATKLKGMGYAPISITQANAGLKKEIKIPGMGDRVKLKDLAISARQFATMINSGLSLLRALSILSDQTDNQELGEVYASVRLRVEQGSSLSQALAQHPKVFPPIMINMTRAGETGGFLDQVLSQFADNFEAEVKLRSTSQVRDDLPAGRLRLRDPVHDGHAAVHRPGVRGSVRRASEVPFRSRPASSLRSRPF